MKTITLKAEEHHRQELRELLEDLAAMKMIPSDQYAYLSSIASEGLLSAFNSRSGLQLVFLATLGLRAIDQTGRVDGEVGADDDELKIWTERLRVILVREELRRHGLARNVRYPSSIFSDEAIPGSAEIALSANIPPDLSALAKAIVTGVRAR